jgi:hypothetical protein
VLEKAPYLFFFSFLWLTESRMREIVDKQRRYAEFINVCICAKWLADNVLGSAKSLLILQIIITLYLYF